MKKTKAVLTFLAAAVLAMGCKPPAEKTPAQLNLDAATDKVAVKTKESAQASRELTAARKEYAYAQKAEFVAEKQSQLAEVDRDLDLLAIKVESGSDVTRSDARPKLQVLRDNSSRLKKQIDEAKAATESAWEDVKTGTSKTYDELKDGFQQARQWVSEKIAP